MSLATNTGPAPSLPSGLSLPFDVTIFFDEGAAEKQQRTYTLAQLADLVRVETKKEKARLPWLKLARFGDARTHKRSLRHNENVLAITGIEADYDGGRVTPEEAVEVLEQAGILGMVYTSPSHTPQAPRWRVLCPVSAELPPQERQHLMGRLNGLYRGILSGESWTLSQSYYYGSVRSNPAHMVELVDGTPIDQADELDAAWTGKAQTEPKRGSTATQSGLAEPRAMDELVAQLVSGAELHATTATLAMRYLKAGMADGQAVETLRGFYEAIPPATRNSPSEPNRWQQRYNEIPRAVSSARAKLGAAPQTGKPDDTWPEPLDFLADAQLTGAPELKPHHLPDAIAPFVFDTAARMGVDPAAVALSALVSLASVVSDDWCIQPKQHDDTWLEQPRIWGAIVGDPSMLKSPIVKVATAPIDRMEADARKAYELAMLRYRTEHKAWKEAGSDPASEPKAPRLTRYLVENTTTEAISEALRDDFEAKQHAPAGKILIRQDEMSEWVASFDRYRSGGKGGADRGAYLRLYNGGRFTVDRVNRGTFAVPNWSACILGGIQPGPIRAIARDAADDGLLQRFCYCVPAKQGRGEDRKPEAAALERYRALFPALGALTPARYLSGEPRPVVLHSDAHPHRVEILDLAEALAAMPDTNDRMKSALGKWPGLWARLVLIFHLIDAADARAQQSEERPMLALLPEAVARRATSYLRDILLPHLLRAEAVMFATEQTGHARWIAGYLLSRESQRVAVRDLVQAYRPLRAPEHRRELLEVMTGLEAMGWIRAETQRDLTRTPTAWEVNPKVHEVFVARAERERTAREAAKKHIAEVLGRTKR